MASRRAMRKQAREAADEARARAEELEATAKAARQKYERARDELASYEDETAKRREARNILERKAQSCDAEAEGLEREDFESRRLFEARKNELAQQAEAALEEVARDYNDSRMESRQSYTERLRTERKRLRKERNDAREAAKAARVEADAAEEKATIAEEARTDVARWLAWDGIYTLAGACNGAYDATVSSRLLGGRRTRTKEEVLEVQLARLQSDQMDHLSARLDSKVVSLRLSRCAEQFVPIEERLLVKARIERLDLVRSMLVRVHDAKGAVVYQEVLDAEQIDRLPRTERTAVQHQRSLAERIDACRDHAGAGDGRSPFRVSVWISKSDDAFAGLDATETPEETPGEQVHDRSSGGRYQTQPGAGVNLTNARPMHLVIAALLSAGTEVGAKRHQRSIGDKTSEIVAVVKRANAELGALRPKELRLYLGPEWSFRAPAYPWTYSPDEKDEIVEAIRAASSKSACKQWLLLPGTILWGERHDSGCLGVLNTMVAASAGSIVHRYNKKLWGGDTKLAQSAFDRCLLETAADGWQRRHNQLNDQRLPKSLGTKMHVQGWSADPADSTVEVMVRDQRWRVSVPFGVTGDKVTYVITRPAERRLDVTPGELFAMTIPATAWPDYFGALSRADFDLPGCFAFAGLNLGLDICADHKGAQCAASFKQAGEHGLGAGKNKGLDLYLVSSNDVQAEPWKVAARTGGYFLHCDGAAYGATAHQVVSRERSVGEIGDIFIKARAACVPTERGRDYQRPTDPCADGPATVSLEALEGESLDLEGGCSLHIYRMILVDP